MQAAQLLPNNCSTLPWWRDTPAEARVQVYNPEEGPLERRVNTQWLDGMFEGEVDLEHTDYWFTEPPGARHRLRGAALASLAPLASRVMPACLEVRCASGQPSAAVVPGCERAWKGLRAGLSGFQAGMAVLCKVKELVHMQADRPFAQDQRVVSRCRVRLG
jgi:hypothetical protein